jgi:glycosyltransferase involved in cell wall biosynthesis
LYSLSAEIIRFGALNMAVHISAVLIGLSGLVLFSQFGRRLSAKHSLVWIAVFGFLIVSAVKPESLAPLSQALGFKLVSNFVLAGLIFFSFLEILQQSAQNVKISRKLREVISSSAAQQFIERIEAHERETTGSVEATNVLVISPCFNEEESLPATIGALAALKRANPGFNFCVVNDGSRDGSLNLLKTHAPWNYTSHLSNAGVGAALLTGFLAAREINVEYVVQCDSDGQHPIADILRLVEEARASRTDLLIGSRFAIRKESFEAVPGNKRTAISKPALESTTFLRWFGGRLISLTLGLFGRSARIKDPTSGFRVYSRRAYLHLIERMPEEYPEPESIALLLQAGMKVDESYVSMRPRVGGVSSLSGFKSAQFMFKVATALLALRLRYSAQRTVR